MGGNAFKHLGVSFPRMQPRVYNALKAALLPALSSLYGSVLVPREAHGKDDYGDLDFIVAFPVPGLTHETVVRALCARHSVPMEGNRQSNFAIPADAPLLVAALSLSSSSALSDGTAHLDVVHKMNSEEEVFFQVDVQVCADQAEVDDHAFYLSYGGVGVLLGLLFMRVGLSFGLSGLRLPDPLPTSPPMTFYLTSSMTDALAFAGLSLDAWRAGFSTQRELFDWVASSPLFDALSFDLNKVAPKKATRDLPLYRAFSLYVTQQRGRAAADEPGAVPYKSGKDSSQEDALRYFGKKDELDVILHIASVRQHVKQVFTGATVRDWTNVQGVPIRWIMDEVKRVLSLDGASGSSSSSEQDMPATTSSLLLSEGLHSVSLPPLERWESAMFDMDLDQVRKVVLEAKDALQAQDRLHFDWRAAKARKDAAKMQTLKLVET